MKKKNDSKRIYNKRLMKNKIKSYGDETTDFHGKEITKVGSNYICLAVILIDLILNKIENYYQQVV